MKWSDKDIQQNLEEIWLENALAAEIAKTSQIIKRTKIFDPVDNIYGEPDANYGNSGNDEQGDAEGGMPGGGGGAPIGGGDMDFGDDGAMEDDMEVGAEGEMGMEDNAAEDGAMPDNPNEGSVPPMNDSIVRKLNLIKENKTKEFRKQIQEKQKKYGDILCERLLNKSLEKKFNKSDNETEHIKSLNEDLYKMIGQLQAYEKE